MTAYTDMTKSDLNDLLPENLRCKNASQLKKTSKADLIDMLERRDATRAEAKALRSVDNKIRDAKIVKAPKARKPRELPDRVMVEPGKPEEVKATKAGSKRHLMAEALAKGATVEELVKLLGWNKDTVTSAFRTDMGALGFGVERKGGKYFLLFPKKIKRLPVTDKGVSRADALVAACK